MKATDRIDPGMDGVIWASTAREPRQPHAPLEADREADLAVIGAGYCGLSIALGAARRGLDVVVLEAGSVGNGASGRNGGFAVPHFPGAMTPSHVSARLGKRKGEALTALVGEGPSRVMDEIARYQIACDAEQNGWIQPAHSQKALALVRKVYEDWRAFGADVEWLDRDAVQGTLGAPCYLGGWRRANGAMVNPYALALGLARAAVNEGAAIHERSAATAIGRDGRRAVVEANGHRVRARKVVMATNGYTDALAGAVDRSVIPIHLFHTVTTPLSAEQSGAIMRDRICFTDIRKSGGFGRFDRDGRLISGGAVFVLGNGRRIGTAHVKRRMAELFPGLGPLEVETYWEGYCALTPEFLPRVQVLDRDVYSILGFSTRGVSLAQNVGRVFAEFVAESRSLDDVPLEVTEGARTVPWQGVKSFAGRCIFPVYKAMDRYGLT